MAAYATVNDLAAGWRPIVGDERGVAEELLDRAGVLLDAYMGSALDASDALQEDVLRICSCDMVRRAMSASGDSFLYAPMADTGAGFTPYNPSGGLNIEATERAKLRQWKKSAFSCVRAASWRYM